MPGGRPSKYKPEFCEKLVEHMSNGYSFASFGGIAKVSEDTLYTWAKVHPEFSEAKKEGRAAELLFWEDIGIRGTMGRIKGFNAVSWIFNMKNRSKWRDDPVPEIENERAYPAVKRIAD